MHGWKVGYFSPEKKTFLQNCYFFKGFAVKENYRKNPRFKSGEME